MAAGAADNREIVMVAPIGVGKAATAVAEGAEKLGSKGAGTATHAASEQFQQLLEDPSHATAGANPGQVAGATGAGGTGAAGTALSSAQAPAQAPAVQTKATEAAAGPGDKILHGIDQIRGEADQLVQQVGAMSEGGGTGKASDMLSMQASLMSFEVATQVGGKGMQETNQAVQTLLKGQ
jgi:hypothetical protein